MKLLKTSIATCIFTIYVIVSVSQAQVIQIPFHSPALSENIDYHSFSPSLMLKHRIGNRFTKLPKNPVLTPTRGDWDRLDVADPFVLVTADSIMLFYAGDNNDQYRIGYAVQDKGGWFWIKRGKFFSSGGNGWDIYHQIAPIVFFHNGFWQLYYNGNDSDEQTSFKWGYAEKVGSDRWYYPRKSPVIEIDTTAWDFTGNVYGDIIYSFEEKKYRMWYTGFQGPLASIGMAESDDGIRWNKVGNQPVLAKLPGVISPEVIYNGEMYRMFFVQLQLEGKRKVTQIASAESKNGIQWANFQEIISPTDKWEKQQLMRPNISYFEGRVYLYYCAGAGDWQIGAAYTKAEFKRKGRWISKPIRHQREKLQIKYEAPAQTSLAINFIDPMTEMTYMVYLEDNRRELRQNIFQSAVEIPDDLRSGNWQVELILKTKNVNLTPVVYEITLL